MRQLTGRRAHVRGALPAARAMIPSLPGCSIAFRLVLVIGICVIPAFARSEPAPDGVARSHLQAAKDLARSGRWAESLVRAVQAHATAPADATPDLTIAITLARAAALQQTERTQAAMQLLLAARTQAQTAGLAEMEAQALLHMSSALGRNGDFDRAEEAIEEGLSIARESGAQGLVVRFLLNLGRVQLARGRTQESAGTVAAASALPLPPDQAEELEHALLVARVAVADQGRDPAGATRLAIEAAETAARRGFRQLEAFASEIAGRRLCRQGSHEDGIRYVLRALSIFPELDAPRDQSRALTALAECHLGRGDARQVHAALIEAITLRDRAHERSRADTDAAAEALYENQRVRSDLAAAQAERSRIAERLATASAETAWALVTLCAALAAVLALLVVNRWARASMRFEKRLADDRAKSFARTSHEIRNPAQALTGLLATAIPETDPARRATMLAAAERAAGVIAELARSYRVVASQHTSGAADPATAADCRPERIARVIEETVRLAEHLPGASGQSIVVSIAPPADQAWLRVDATVLTQVLLNLLSNARRYAGASEIRVAAQRTSSGDLSVVVEDDGPGLRTNESTRLFEPGARGAASGAWPDGDGLGLAISREILARCGGQLHAGASRGNGARFEIQLPWHAATPPEQPNGSRPSTGRVLVVDDDPLVRAALAAQLESLGFSVQLDSGTSEIERILSAFDPQVVVLDRNIGSMLGKDLAERMRRWDLGRGSKRRIVMLSGGAADDPEESSRYFDAVACKPISSEALATLVAPGAPEEPTPHGAMRAPTPAGMEPTMSTATAPPRIDHDTVSRLKQLEAGRPGLLAKLLDTFGANQRRFVDELRDAASNPEAGERLRIGAHSLKGSAASLGAPRLSELAGRLEHAMNRGDTMEIEANARRVVAEFEPSLDALRTAFLDTDGKRAPATAAPTGGD